ncbi:MAG: NADH-quinone oxidoreductase subunit NuoB [Verrucomicrobia bacterium]|nr:NADH-quinone oxidoreductase subunit NuoB [Verrucomicrobiota bacterium]
MIEILKVRLKQGCRTMSYPAGPAPEMPPHFTGRPVIHPESCGEDCRECIEVCPSDAISVTGSEVRIDTGRCIFCAKCRQVCPEQIIDFSPDFRLAAARREDLVLGSGDDPVPSASSAVAKKLFGRSLKLRQVSAGGCNACEADTNVLNTLAWDLGRFGIQFVASPRHADGLLVTGPVTNHMELALKKTYEALPDPKIVIAVGACAASGGIFRTHPESSKVLADIIPVDLFIPGCPPHPATILDGLLRLVGRIDEKE